MLTRRRIVRVGLTAATLGATASYSSHPVFAQPLPLAEKSDIAPEVIGVCDFIAGNQEAESLADDIVATVRDDLRQSGSLKVLDPVEQPDKTPDPDRVPQFDKWRSINVKYLVVGMVAIMPDGRLRLLMRSWDVSTGSQIAGLMYAASTDQWRRAGHDVAEQVISAIRKSVR
jgi:TolB protein